MPHATFVQAGPLRLRLVGGDLMDVRFGSRQLVSRLGVKVRDSAWGTVPAALSAPRLAVREDRFEAHVAGTHTGRGVDFAWEGQIAGEPDGTLVYTMDGIARADCAFNRIGLCVLHSAPACAGRPYRARGPTGAHAGRLPELVGPQRMEGETIFPLFPAFTELDLELGGGLVHRLLAEGDVFEMEDQRNWTDGSFKTYSTPVGLPVPHRIAAGERIRQRVRLELRAGARAGSRARSRPEPDLVVGDAIGTALPPVGVELDGDGHEPSEMELAALGELRPAHLRLSLSATDADVDAALARARRVTARLGGARLELAVTLAAREPLAGADALADALAAGPPPVRAIVLQEGRRVTDPAAVAALRERLGRAAPPLLGGTDMYFAELNRERPAMDLLEGLAYPITPQVHDDDEPALVESLAAQADTVATARSFAAGRPVHVSPVTLKPRWNPFARTPERVPPGRLPAAVDARQPTDFAGAWTVGSIRRLGAAGVASITYYELTGWRGLVEREAGSPLPDRFPTRPGQPFPVLSVLRDACAWVGADLLRVEPADPLATEALAVRRGAGTLVLVANLLPASRTVTVATPGRAPCELQLAAWEVRRLVLRDDGA